MYDYEFNPKEYRPEDYGVDLSAIPLFEIPIKSVQTPFINASAPRPISVMKAQTPVNTNKPAVIIPVQKVNIIKNISSVRPLAPSNLNIVKRPAPVAAGVVIHPLVKQALQFEESINVKIKSPEKKPPLEWKPLPSKTKSQSSLFSPLAPPQ